MTQIYIGASTASQLKSYAAEHSGAVITDENVYQQWQDFLNQTFSSFQILVLPAGEHHKNFATYRHILQQLLNHHHQRHQPIVSFGGGVVTDLAGFVAATYQRGVPLVHCPTSLLACVDTAVGGKCGINLGTFKNQVGSIYPAQAVYINTDWLSTLSEREFNAGMAEVIKIAVLRDADFFTWLAANVTQLRQHDTACLQTMISKAIALKQTVVEQDLYDHGLRQILNFGHTIGHALELQDHPGTILHGEAVSIGMITELNCITTGTTQTDLIKQLTQLLECFDLPTQLPDNSSLANLFKMMQRDKKSTGDTVNFTTIERIGYGRLSPQHLSKLEEVLQRQG